MSRQWFQTFLSGRSTWLVIGAFTACALISYLIALGQIRYFASLAENPAPDLNVEALSEIYANSKALYYYFTFLFMSPLHQLCLMAFLAINGLFLSARPLEDRRLGFGNFCLSRTSFRAYSASLLRAQTACIAVVVTAAYRCRWDWPFFLGDFRRERGMWVLWRWACPEPSALWPFRFCW